VKKPIAHKTLWRKRLNNKRKRELATFLAQLKLHYSDTAFARACHSIYMTGWMRDHFNDCLISGLLGFWQEKGAASAIEKLLEIVQSRSACFATHCNGDCRRKLDSAILYCSRPERYRGLFDSGIRHLFIDEAI